jgi:hypothetical protein
MEDLNKRKKLIQESLTAWNSEVLNTPFSHRPTVQVVAFLSGIPDLTRGEITDEWNTLQQED